MKTVRFFLFDSNEDALQTALETANLSLGDLNIQFKPTFNPPAIDGSNNPWRVVDRNGEEIFVPVDRGFSVAYEGQQSAVVDLFETLEQSGVARIAGVDVLPELQQAAPAWEHWCPGTGGAGSFGKRDQAERLIEAQTLADQNLTGKNVNIFVVDQGLSQTYVGQIGNSSTYAGGFSLGFGGQVKISGQFDQPFVKMRKEHGNMMVRNLLTLAPDARIYDIPLIPRRIVDVLKFADYAAFVYLLLAWFVNQIPGRSVIVNAWGIYNRFREPILGDYTTRPSHPLNIWVDKLAQNQDVVFAAGNSGQFCPDPRSGPYDRGPGHSIWGANALHRAISVGATRSDALWIGASSQGPGPAVLSPGSSINEKPDFCAPSWFRENQDAHLPNSGTSAACGVTAGVVAALREHWTVATPDEMKTALRKGARKIWHTGWNGRLGEGVLNVPGTIKALPPSS